MSITKLKEFTKSDTMGYILLSVRLYSKISLIILYHMGFKDFNITLE